MGLRETSSFTIFTFREGGRVYVHQFQVLWREEPFQVMWWSASLWCFISFINGTRTVISVLWLLKTVLSCNTRERNCSILNSFTSLNFCRHWFQMELHKSVWSTVSRLADQSNMVIGFSRRFLNAPIHCAPTAPSTTLWSQLSVTDITVPTEYLGRQDKVSRGLVNLF